MGHIQLSRAPIWWWWRPATADLMAKMAHGHANDLASTLSDGDGQAGADRARDECADVGASRHAAQPGGVAGRRGAGGGAERRRHGLRRIRAGAHGRGARDRGGRRAALGEGPLKGRHVLVTSGPTHEPIDPVRYIANRSSGAQGTALAAALRDLGARVTFVTGPASVPPPAGVTVVRVETAQEMAAAVEGGASGRCGRLCRRGGRLARGQCGGAEDEEGGHGRAAERWISRKTPTFWRVSRRWARGGPGWSWALPPRPRGWRPMRRPNARARAATGSWPMMSRPARGSWAGAENAVTLITAEGAEAWPRMAKPEVARRLAARIAAGLGLSFSRRICIFGER
jgi:phosphopantothenoylcysteine decarboxylase / phosphopantothenate---cysteine ligase